MRLFPRDRSPHQRDNRTRHRLLSLRLLSWCAGALAATAIAMASEPARAQWGGWEGLGGVILDAPSCENWGPNRIDCFARGTDRAMYHRWWNGAAWGGWENLGGIILEAPRCVTWSANRIDCFA